MKKKVILAALSGLAWVVTGSVIQPSGLSLAAELDGFAINTQEKSVTITLFTDQKVSYTTERQGKQFAIILPGTQLSREQVENGLPVVIDNKNRFIGRAVTADDGKVKIILPNLPANDYTVSVQQKMAVKNNASATTAQAVPVIKPRPTIHSSASNRFEQVAASFQKPVEQTSRQADEQTSRRATLHLTPSAQTSNTDGGNSSTIWNPYVVRRSGAKTGTDLAQSRKQSSDSLASLKSAYANYRPVSRVKSKLMPATASQSRVSSQWDDPQSGSNEENIAFSAVSHQPPPLINEPFQAETDKKSGADPLWYLHSLPTISSNEISSDGLSGPALIPGQNSDAGLSESVENKVASQTEKQVSVSKKPENLPKATRFTVFRQVLAKTSPWLIMTLALFLGGMGIFGLAGGLVLLKVLFSYARQSLGQTNWNRPLAEDPSAMSQVNQPRQSRSHFAMPYIESPKRYGLRQSSSVHVSKRTNRPAFVDTSSVVALDYLKTVPDDIGQAVKNISQVKLPHHLTAQAKRNRRSYSMKTQPQSSAYPQGV